MGRPLSKKYFGNRNIGTGGDNTTGPLSNSQNYGDDRIGGEGLASALVLTGAGKTAGNYINRLPTIVSLGAPTLPGGVQAAGVLHSVAQSASPAARGTGYWVGDIITDDNGSTWRVTKLEVATATLDPAHQGSGYGGDDNIPYPNGIVINLDGVNGSGVPNGNVDWTKAGTSRGSWTTTGAGPTNTGAQSPSGLGGSGAQWILTWGIKELAFVSSVDYNYTDRASYSYSTDNTVTGGHGTNGALDVGFSPSYIAITEKGSGYVSAPAIAFTTAPNPGESRAVGATTLTTDSGVTVNGENAADNQENAIICYAQTTISGSNLIGDIIKQQGKKRYKVVTTDGIAYCNLKTTGAANAVGEMTITATDSLNKTYYVAKLTAHRVTLVPYGSSGHVFPLLSNNEPQSVHWTFSTDDATYNSATSVVVANA